MTSRFWQISAATVLAMATAGPARAQSNSWIGAPAAYSNDDYRGPYAETQRAAYDNGYRDGLKRGEQALRDRRPLDAEREREYRQAENGYNRTFGDRDRYRDNYRVGFAQGYRDGYNRFGSGSNGVWSAARPYPSADRGYGRDAGFGAFQNGVSDGYRKGLDDVQDRKSPDVTRQKWYRNGDHDYDSRYGSKDSYRLEYRRGFSEGYNRAYQEARRLR
jgi:hypothetical protein